jgi:hypothetical protein
MGNIIQENPKAATGGFVLFFLLCLWLFHLSGCYPYQGKPRVWDEFSSEVRSVLDNLFSDLL